MGVGFDLPRRCFPSHGEKLLLRIAMFPSVLRRALPSVVTPHSKMGRPRLLGLWWKTSGFRSHCEGLAKELKRQRSQPLSSFLRVWSVCAVDFFFFFFFFGKKVKLSPPPPFCFQSFKSLNIRLASSNTVDVWQRKDCWAVQVMQVISSICDFDPNSDSFDQRVKTKS